MMGKLDLVKGQPPYLAEKSKKRKNPHESDHGENATGHSEKVKKPRKPKNLPQIAPMPNDPTKQWRILNRQAAATSSTSVVQFDPVPTPTVHVTTVPGSSKSSFPVDPIRPVKRAKPLGPSTFTPAGDYTCPLCDGPKHELRDCPVPKGGVEK